jgi:hypothetical protein
MPRNRALSANESPQEPLRDENRLLEELVAVINVAVAACWFVSFYAYHAGLNIEMGGRVGHGLASAVVQASDLSYLIPSCLLVVAGALFFRAADELTVGRAAVGVFLILCSAIGLGLIAPNQPVTVAGGWVGGFVASLSREAFGTLGSFLLVGASILLSFVFVTRISLGRVISLAASGARRSASRRPRRPQVARVPAETVVRQSGNVERSPAGKRFTAGDRARGCRARSETAREGEGDPEEFQFEQSTRYRCRLTLLDAHRVRAR